MVTYPSTYGVFEEEIKTIIDCIHSHGGQVHSLRYHCALCVYVVELTTFYTVTYHTGTRSVLLIGSHFLLFSFLFLSYPSLLLFFSPLFSFFSLLPFLSFPFFHFISLFFSSLEV